MRVAYRTLRIGFIARWLIASLVLVPAVGHRLAIFAQVLALLLLMSPDC